MRRGYLEQLARIETEARKLARSDEHQGSSSIEMALLIRGYREAPKLLANRWTQYELDRLCEQATHRGEGGQRTEAAYR
jgi:hypothetical protein